MRYRLAMIVAIFALLVGGFGIYNNALNQNKSGQSVVSQQKESSPTREDVVYVTTWRANGDLARGEPISVESVKREQLPINIALDEGISTDIQLDFSPSTLLNTNIEKGQLVLPEHQTSENDPGYIDLLITEGMEPYPMLVSSANLVKGYIRPGTVVDVLAISSPNENLSSERTGSIEFNGLKANLLLQNVKVLSVSDLVTEEDAKLQARSSTDDEQHVLVVVEVDPADIARISIAQKTMHLEVYRSHKYDKPIYAEVRNVIDNYTGVSELRGSSRQSKQGEEL